jgi:hypothetical protein
MPTTPNLALPYPAETDTADVPRDIHALATKLDLSGSAGTVLPASPTDGQEYFYVANAANGVVWHLRYRAASASPYKWEYVGGSALVSSPASGSITTQTPGWVALTAGPTITLPLAGQYLVGLDLFAQLNGAATGQMSAQLAANGVAQGNLGSLVALGQYGAANITRPPAGVGARAAGDVMSIQVNPLSGINATFSQGVLSVLPVRVG